MKIYFGGSIRGGRRDKDKYLLLIEKLKQFGQVLTEHVGDGNLTQMGEETPVQTIFGRDTKWLAEADVVIIDVSTPSLGVGYEVRMAEELGKRMLCIYHERENESLSPMVDGNPKIVVERYRDLGEALEKIESFMESEFG